MLVRLVKLLIVLTGLATIIGFLSVYVLYRPKYQGELTLQGLKTEVKITRNKDTGIPIVEAEDKLDALFGLGFLHAQDRLWQLEKMRRISQGRLSEIFGERVIKVDKLQRTLGLKRVAEETANGLSQRERELVQAYCDGINAYVSKISLLAEDKSQRVLPPEFYMVGLVSFQPWTIVDSLAILKLLNFNLTWNWN